MTTLAFFLISFSFAFIIADASIFGVPTTAYVSKPDDDDYNKNEGVIKIRYHLLRVEKIQKFFSCYFCLGVWTGAMSHLFIYLLSFYIPDLLSSYILLSSNTTLPALVFTTIGAAAMSAPVCLFINTVQTLLELKIEQMDL